MKTVSIFVFFCILLFLTSCKPLSSPGPENFGDLTMTELKNLTGIPSGYGPCIGITTHSQYEGWAQLWFQDDSMTIRMVRVQFHDRKIHDEVLVIPRN
jgi:hypothetical protein